MAKFRTCFTFAGQQLAGKSWLRERLQLLRGRGATPTRCCRWHIWDRLHSRGAATNHPYGWHTLWCRGYNSLWSYCGNIAGRMFLQSGDARPRRHEFSSLPLSFLRPSSNFFGLHWPPAWSRDAITAHCQGKDILFQDRRLVFLQHLELTLLWLFWQACCLTQGYKPDCFTSLLIKTLSLWPFAESRMFIALEQEIILTRSWASFKCIMTVSDVNLQSSEWESSICHCSVFLACRSDLFESKTGPLVRNSVRLLPFLIYRPPFAFIYFLQCADFFIECWSNYFGNLWNKNKNMK